MSLSQFIKFAGRIKKNLQVESRNIPFFNTRSKKLYFYEAQIVTKPSNSQPYIIPGLEHERKIQNLMYMWFGIESVQAFTFATGNVGANIIPANNFKTVDIGQKIMSKSVSPPPKTFKSTKKHQINKNLTSSGSTSMRFKQELKDVIGDGLMPSKL